MGVFYEVRVHLAENADDFVGKKGTTVSMGIRKVGCEVLSVYWRGGEKGIVNYYCYYDGQYLQAQYASADMKQRSPTSTAEKGFMFGSGKCDVSHN